MLHKTRGIVFKTTDYGDSSMIVQIFTEKFGLQTYMVNGAKKPKAKIAKNMLQPLHLLDMVVYHKNNGNIQRIKELKNSPQLLNIPYDLVKSSIALFLNEVIYKAAKQQGADEGLFSFLFSAIEWLDNESKGLANFHLVFMLKLTRFLGFYPDRPLNGDADYFDLKDGIFSRFKPESILYLSPPHTQNFIKLLLSSFESLDEIKLSNEERRFLVQKILDYYAMHAEGFGNIKSHEVLEEIFN
jgi:DNA repair protein RecO (recombination protein O)